jgi:ABC-2 type transport system permease protein
MTRFYAEYPEYRSFQAPEDRFTWGWYYAMQHMGDVEAAGSSAALRDKLRAREMWISRLSWLSPAALVQGALNRVAATDLSNHAAYLQSVREFHEQIRRFFYPFLFREGRIPVVNWAGLPTHRFSDETQQVRSSNVSTGLLISSAVLLCVAAVRLRSAQKVVGS